MVGLRHALKFSLQHQCRFLLEANPTSDFLRLAQRRSSAGYRNDAEHQTIYLDPLKRLFDFRAGDTEPTHCQQSLSTKEVVAKRDAGDLPVTQLTPAQERAVDAAFNEIWGINATHAFGRRCPSEPYLGLHVRSGDLFRGTWGRDGQWVPGEGIHPLYTQPSLSYYTRCIEDAAQRGVARVRVTCEDMNNPVCLALRAFSGVQSLGLEVDTLALHDALAMLACATYACAAFGTFAFAWHNTVHNRNFTYPPNIRLVPADATQLDAGQCENNRLGPEMTALTSLFPTNRTTRLWTGSCLQRIGMLI